jgi:hypothetical protein
MSVNPRCPKCGVILVCKEGIRNNQVEWHCLCGLVGTIDEMRTQAERISAVVRPRRSRCRCCGKEFLWGDLKCVTVGRTPGMYCKVCRLAEKLKCEEARLAVREVEEILSTRVNAGMPKQEAVAVS